MTALDDEIGTLYAGALAAIARADGEIGPEEGMRLEAVLARRTTARFDPEALFFDPVTPESMGRAFAGRDPHRGGADPRALGLMLIEDAIEVSTSDGDLNGREAHVILRFARALGLTADDVRSRTDELEEWIADLAH